jgi:hypothetical protein
MSRGGGWKRHAPKLLLSCLLGAAIAWLVARGGLPLVPPAEAWKDTSPLMLALAWGVGCLVQAVRVARWRLLLRPIAPVPLSTQFSVTLFASAIIFLAPLRSGELARPLLLARRSPVRVWQAAGTVAAERVVDGLVLSLVLFGALTWTPQLSPLPERVGELGIPLSVVPRAAYGMLTLFVGAFALMGIFCWRRAWAERTTRSLLSPFSPRLAQGLAAVVGRVGEGLSFLPSWRLSASLGLETLAYWGLNALFLYLLALGAGLRGMSYAHACVVLGLLGIGVVVPSGPGFFGAFQLCALLGLALYFPEVELQGHGACYIFLLYVGQLVFTLVPALVVWLLDPELRRAVAFGTATETSGPPGENGAKTGG